jgi:hypothetical protein
VDVFNAMASSPWVRPLDLRYRRIRDPMLILF